MSITMSSHEKSVLAEGTPRAPGRIDLLDVARGIALIAMLVYHFTWDLEFFGYLPAGTAGTGGWRLFARAIAASFLFLVGVSLVLAHLRGVRWPSFGKRLGQIAAGAAAVSLVTWLFIPDAFVFFGILHQIAVASLIGLLFLRVPPALTALTGAVVIALPAFFAFPVMDTRWLAWIGFAAREPISNDLVPVFPWTGIVLLGIAVSRVALERGLWHRLAQWRGQGRIFALLRVIGQHALAFYLLHQPISIAIVATAAFVAPPDRIAAFPQECQSSCLAQEADAAFCEAYCGCVQTQLVERNLLADLVEGRLGEDGQRDVRDTILACSFSPGG